LQRVRFDEFGVEPMDMDLARVDRYARLHRGLLSFPDSGLTRRQWNEAIQNNEIERQYRDVARLYGAPISRALRIEAAILAAGLDALASHRTSTWLWDAERPNDDPVDLILPERTRRARLPDWIVVHRPRDLQQLRPVWRQGIPTTDPLRTLLDLGAVDPTSVDAALTRFVVSGLVTPNAVRAAIVRHSKQGRHGIVALRNALERWSLDNKPADSDLEVLMAQVLTTYSLPPAQFHARLSGYEVDFWIIGSKVVIECDGWMSHGADREQFEFDRIRNSELSADGFVIVHVTWRQLITTPRAVALRIERNLARWSPEILAARCAESL
jgi:very-short-patch-repair endonuclease